MRAGNVGWCSERAESEGLGMHKGKRLLEVIAQEDERYRDEFEERAAILEYEAGMDRAAAEKAAKEQVLYRMFGVGVQEELRL